MKIEPLPLSGCYLITSAAHKDSRGQFGRLCCQTTLEAAGLQGHFRQTSFAINTHRLTLRGLHLQRPPYSETKIIRVMTGAAFDVLVDVRAGSPTFGQWFGIELNAQAGIQIYAAPGVAHGYQTLSDETMFLYFISPDYQEDAVDGIHWADPDLAITWPNAAEAIRSPRDDALPRLRDFSPC
jgi:dTDP-4-dehydrorhamnose 3,5-epimerase